MNSSCPGSSTRTYTVRARSVKVFTTALGRRRTSGTTRVCTRRSKRDLETLLLWWFLGVLRTGTTGAIDFFYGRPAMQHLAAECSIAAYRASGLRAALALASRDQNIYMHRPDEEVLAELDRHRPRPCAAARSATRTQLLRCSRRSERWPTDTTTPAAPSGSCWRPTGHHRARTSCCKRTSSSRWSTTLRSRSTCSRRATRCSGTGERIAAAVSSASTRWAFSARRSPAHTACGRPTKTCAFLPTPASSWSITPARTCGSHRGSLRSAICLTPAYALQSGRTGSRLMTITI